jgi:hypothetical protein
VWDTCKTDKKIGNRFVLKDGNCDVANDLNYSLFMLLWTLRFYFLLKQKSNDN